MTRVHHTALCPADLEASLRFYRDGLGFSVLMDHEFDGDWPGLFDAPTDRLRAVFLGDPDRHGAGIVELVGFAEAAPAVAAPAPAAPPAFGFFLLSLYLPDVGAALERLAALGLGGVPRRITVPGPGGRAVAMATVRDPDGVLVELVEADAS